MLKKGLTLGALLAFLIFMTHFIYNKEFTQNYDVTSKLTLKKRSHYNHQPLFQKEFSAPQEVTQTCLKCHKTAAQEMMKSSHWTWITGDSKAIRKGKVVPVGKKTLLNNYCLTPISNWTECTACHAGYGWEDKNFDFTNEKNIDCLICHERSGTYQKGDAGYPREGVSLLTAAQSVGYPLRENCGTCHFNGGGGHAVKHGDLDNSLINPSYNLDVHMGGQNLLCIDCHTTQKHITKGVNFATCSDCSKNLAVHCTECHDKYSHKDKRINQHENSVACQTCHIPEYAKAVPTKTSWDWSKAGDMKRADSPHEYLKIKGEFIYEQNVTPHYAWFQRNVDRYLLGDEIHPESVVPINRLIGSIEDEHSLIWPFKVHKAVQPYDLKFKTLLVPHRVGEGGYSQEFNWDKAFQMGMDEAGLPYSGQFGWVHTVMYWPLSHMVSPSSKALNCQDCHGSPSRMPWGELGYTQDPMYSGGRYSKGFKK